MSKSSAIKSKWKATICSTSPCIERLRKCYKRIMLLFY
jgi:hypothetical protein